MPERAMTIKRFISLKLSKKNQPNELLTKNSEFLGSFSFLKEVLDTYRSGKILPTPTFQAIQAILYSYYMKEQKEWAEKTLAKDVEKFKHTLRDKDGNVILSPIDIKGRYQITLMVKKYQDDVVIGEEVGVIESFHIEGVENDKGELVDKKVKEIKPAIFFMDDYGAAERLAHRKLVADESSLYCIIEQTFDKKVETKIDRKDAFAAIFRNKARPVMKKMSANNKPLKWHGKAQQTRSIGSWSIRK
jgi:hypothetical protein